MFVASIAIQLKYFFSNNYTCYICCIKSCSENLDSQFLLKMVHVREPAFVRAHLEFLFYDINSHCYISKEIAGNKIYETKMHFSHNISVFGCIFWGGWIIIFGISWAGFLNTYLKLTEKVQHIFFLNLCSNIWSFPAYEFHFMLAMFDFLVDIHSKQLSVLR